MSASGKDSEVPRDSLREHKGRNRPEEAMDPNSALPGRKAAPGQKSHEEGNDEPEQGAGQATPEGAVYARPRGKRVKTPRDRRRQQQRPADRRLRELFQKLSHIGEWNIFFSDHLPGPFQWEIVDGVRTVVCAATGFRVSENSFITYFTNQRNHEPCTGLHPNAESLARFIEAMDMYENFLYEVTQFADWRKLAISLDAFRLSLIAGDELRDMLNAYSDKTYYSYIGTVLESMTSENSIPSHIRYLFRDSMKDEGIIVHGTDEEPIEPTDKELFLWYLAQTADLFFIDAKAGPYKASDPQQGNEP